MTKTRPNSISPPCPYKIVRGVYLTGLGQEDEVFYFKIKEGHKDFDSLETGQVCLTFYQGRDMLTLLPAIIRVDNIITAANMVQKMLNKEVQKGYPLVPIIGVVDDFDVLEFEEVMMAGRKFQEEVDDLSCYRYKQGDLFDELV